MNPILSIVIPTKNRYETLYDLISFLMNWTYDNFEVIIQDNSTDNHKGLVLKARYAFDERLKYYYCSDNLSAIENCQQAIENTNGEYVCFLGDDDGIISHCVKIAMWMKESNIDSMTCKHGNYFWPEYRVKNQGKKLSLAGTLTYRNNSGTIENLNAIKELETVIQFGGLIMNKITRVYHGIVSKSALNKVLEKTGSYFPGPVPDMTSSVALSFFVNKHVFIDYPIIIAGASKNSMAGRGGQKQAHGKIEDEKSLPVNTVNDWSKEIPRYWAPNTIWPEGLLQALKRTDNKEFIGKVNLMKVYAALYIDTVSYRADLIKFIQENLSTTDFLNFKKIVKKEYISILKNKIKQRLKVISIILKIDSLLGFTTIYSDNISGALDQLEKKTDLYVKKQKNHFSDIINNGKYNF